MLLEPIDRRLARSLAIALTIALTVLAIACPRLARATDYSFTWGHPRPQGNALGGVAFEDASTGYAVGARGAVVRTTDGGASWRLVTQYPQFAADLEDVIVRAPGDLIAVGASPGIFHSSDGGASWSPVANPSTGLLHDLKAITHAVLSAVGSNGQVLRSTDAGDTWSLLAPAGGDLHGQVWLDPSNGYVMGDTRVRRTTNGGATWSPLNGITDSDSFNDGFFTDAQHGYVLSDFSLWKSTNGGTTWTQIMNPPFLTYAGSAVVLGPQHFLVATRLEGAFIEETTDGGVSWGLRFNSGAGGFLDFDRTAAGLLIAVGSEGDIFASTDDGATWTNRITAAAPPRQTIGAICVGPGGSGAAGTSGSPGIQWYRTTDAGMTWNLDPGGPAIPFTSDIDYWDADHAVAAGDYGKIWRSTDGGLTWSAVIPPNMPINGQSWHVSLPASGIGYAVVTGQSQSLVYRTTDFGASWETRNSGIPTSGGLTSIGFPTASIGYVSGYTGGGQPKMYKTTDGGASWAPVSPAGLPASWLWDMHWIDANVGLGTMYTSPGGIFRTTDGGATWANVEPTPAYDLSFSNALHGVAGGLRFFSDGQVFVTENGGITWQTVEVLATGSGNSVAAMPDGFLVAGDYGVIVKSTRVNPAEVDAGESANPASRPGEAVLKTVSSHGSRFGFRFLLPAADPADLSVVDVLGRHVASLVGGTFAGQVPHDATWEGVDERGARAPSGVYFVRLRYGSRAAAVRVVLAR